MGTQDVMVVEIFVGGVEVIIGWQKPIVGLVNVVCRCRCSCCVVLPVADALANANVLINVLATNQQGERHRF